MFKKIASFIYIHRLCISKMHCCLAPIRQNEKEYLQRLPRFVNLAFSHAERLRFRLEERSTNANLLSAGRLAPMFANAFHSPEGGCAMFVTKKG